MNYKCLSFFLPFLFPVTLSFSLSHTHTHSLNHTKGLVNMEGVNTGSGCRFKEGWRLGRYVREHLFCSFMHLLLCL